MSTRTRVSAAAVLVVLLALLVWFLRRDHVGPGAGPVSDSNETAAGPEAPPPEPRLAAGTGAPKKKEDGPTPEGPPPTPPTSSGTEEAKRDAGTVGRVVDTDGRPVANLDLALTWTVVPGWSDRDVGWQTSVVGREGRPDAGHIIAVDPHANVLPRSDEQGRFRVETTQGMGFAIRSRSLRWRVRGSGGIPNPETPIVVVPAISRRVRFVSDDDRVPLPPEFGVGVTGPGRGSRFTIGSPTLVLTIDADRVVEKPIEFTVTAEPGGFLPEQKVVDVTGEEVQPVFEIRLHPVEKRDHATVEFLLASTDAEFLKRPFDIEVRDAQKHDLVVARPQVEALGDGRLRATVPPGNWFLRLRPSDGWCNPVFWEGVQTLPEGRTTTVTWTVPPHGSAIVRVPSRLRTRGASMILLSLASGGGGSVGLLEDAMSEKGTRVQALSEGSWRLAVYGDHLSTLSEKTFDVKPGEQVEIVLGE